jgi:exoribonuclease R
MQGKVGILRTLPPAQPESIDKLRRTAQGLGLSWPGSMSYPEFVRSLDGTEPKQAAMLNACTLLFRGASYAAFSSATPEQPLHAAIAAPYAHCTAPLRRLVDRYAGEVCVSLCAGRPVPEWVLAALEALPEQMSAADHRAKKYERGIVDLVEALLLKDRIGQTFEGTIVEIDAERGEGRIQIAEPPVEARVRGRHLVLGSQTHAVLTSANVETGDVQFRV